ncbi:MAG: transposase [Pseudomonadota bacterium]
MAKKIKDGIPDELLKDGERLRDLLRDGGLLKDLKTARVRRMLGAALTEHLGHARGHEAPPVQTKHRNGVSRKTGQSEDGAFELEVPRDR